MRAPAKWLDKVFEISKRDSTLRIEVKAGLATFFSLSYIFVLAPTLLAGMGLDARNSLLVIIALSSISTVIAGCWAKIPFAFAPGLEMLLYVAFVAIPIYGQAPPYALLCVLMSGVILTVIAWLEKTHKIHSFLPGQFSDAVAISMSVFLFAQASRIEGFLTYDQGWVHLGGVSGSHWIIGASGGVIALVLDAIGVPAPVLISVLLVSILTGKPGVDSSAVLVHRSSFAGLREIVRLRSSAQQLWPAITTTSTLLVLSLYGSLSKVVNLWEKSKDVSVSAAGNRYFVPGIDKLMQVEGVSAFASGIFGITNVTVFVESGAGIRVGGRTGVASIITGLSMLSALFLIGDIRYINPIASVGALLYVGILFFPNPRSLTLPEWSVIGAMTVIIVVWMSLFWAFFLGLVGFICVSKINGRPGKRRTDQ